MCEPAEGGQAASEGPSACQGRDGAPDAAGPLASRHPGAAEAPADLERYEEPTDAEPAAAVPEAVMPAKTEQSDLESATAIDAPAVGTAEAQHQAAPAAAELAALRKQIDQLKDEVADANRGREAAEQRAQQAELRTAAVVNGAAAALKQQAAAGATAGVNAAAKLATVQQQLEDSTAKVAALTTRSGSQVQELGNLKAQLTALTAVNGPQPWLALLIATMGTMLHAQVRFLRPVPAIAQTLKP